MLAFPARSATAQQPPSTSDDPVAEAAIRIGPFGINPRFGITNLGWDNNVFNEVVDPKGDFTITVTPGTDVAMRTGRGLLTLGGSVDLVYYAEYDNQRAFNSRGSGQYEFRFNRIRPLASFAVADVKERPGFEIDTRVRTFTDTLTAGADIRLASKTFFQIGYRKQDTIYEADAVFDGQDLKRSLDRSLNALDGTLRYRMTSQTTLFLHASSEQERFEFATERNSNSGRANFGVELGRRALIRGIATVGFRSLAAADGGLIPAFRGITANVDVTYTAPSQTRINARVPRDVQYSYDPNTPYYIQTGLTLTVTQRITGRWDVQAVGARERLDYQAAANNPSVERIDHVNQVGGGIGYQLNEQMRVSFDVRSAHRQSPRQTEYRTFRAFVSVSYAY